MRAPSSFLLTALLLSAAPAQAELELVEVQISQSAQTVLMDLDLRIDDTELAISRALLRGEVWLDIEITLLYQQRWFGQEPVGQIRILQRLDYDPVNKAYQVVRVNQDERQTFPSLARALARLRSPGTIAVTRLEWLLPEPDRYQGEVRAHLYANPIPVMPAMEAEPDRTLDWHSNTLSWRLP